METRVMTLTWCDDIIFPLSQHIKRSKNGESSYKEVQPIYTDLVFGPTVSIDSYN